MKLAVVGSRNFNEYDLLESHLNSLLPSQIIPGGAKGADSLAEQYAEKYSISIHVFKPDWKKYGRGAGIVRNKEIVDAADHVLAFWDGKSKGTKSSIDHARKNNKPVTIIDISL